MPIYGQTARSDKAQQGSYLPDNMICRYDFDSHMLSDTAIKRMAHQDAELLEFLKKQQSKLRYSYPLRTFAKALYHKHPVLPGERKRSPKRMQTYP